MNPPDDGDDRSDADDASFPSPDELVAELETVRLSPTEHQRIKDLVNRDLAELKGYERRYLSVGAGGSTDAATRRMIVYNRLNDRTDPPAIAFRLEDYGLTPDEIELWIRVFDILCGRATHIVAVIEDFDGGYVWELGLLFAPSYREKVWILKRTYENSTVERRLFKNGMAASHIKALLTGPRCHEWADTDELRDAVREIP